MREEEKVLAEGMTAECVTLQAVGSACRLHRVLVSKWRGLRKGDHQAEAAKSQRDPGPVVQAGFMGCPYTHTADLLTHQKFQEASFFCNVSPVPSTKKAYHHAHIKGKCLKKSHWSSYSMYTEGYIMS